MAARHLLKRSEIFVESLIVIDRKANKFFEK